MQLKTMLTGLAGATLAAPAFAQELEVLGAPKPGGYGFQPAATGLAEQVHSLNNLLLFVITVISLLVIGLIAYVIVRFNQKANPTPARFTHHTPIEIIWTIGPIITLVVIAAFSLPVLFAQQEIPEGDITIKVTGYQWYWGYEYVGEELEYESNMIGNAATIDEDTRPADADVRPLVLDDAMVAKLEDAGFSRSDFLLATDTSVIVPTGKTIVMQVTAADVIHSWTIPAFGVKQDAVPGRLAELWFNVDEGKEGIYFGQCSELCGIAHAYMPITVQAVPQDVYDAWLAASKDADEYVDIRSILTN
ncbi:MAG: cytochrome c oxidase subunit II [Pelagimonas sp.]|jgi:cytochrome c oxidase subunit 2|nr:cytochrome c oxidase subunit II [Pelagimonas sp.]